VVLLINTQTSIPSWLNNRVGKDRKIRKKSDNHCKQAGRRHGSLRCKRAMFTPETRQTDSNIVILTEPFKITCWWCCYVHHRPKWCFSDKKLRNLMPWFCREFAAIFVTFFNCLPRFSAFLPRFSSDPNNNKSTETQWWALAVSIIEIKHNNYDDTNNNRDHRCLTFRTVASWHGAGKLLP